MSRLEKKFIISRTIDLSQVTPEPKHTKRETHFSIPWCMVYYKSNDHFSFGVLCEYTESEKWEIQTELTLRLNSSNGTILQLKAERSFENSNVSEEAWCWCVDFMKLEWIEEHYVLNGKFEIEAQVIIKKMDGFGIEKSRYFDEHSQNHWDIIISVYGQKFHLLKASLAFQSIYFDKLLFGSFNEASQEEVELKEVDQEDFQSFLELIHGESAVNGKGFIEEAVYRLSYLDTNIDGVLHLSDMFDTPTAIRRCEEFLIEKSKRSLDEKIQLAERYSLKELMINLQKISKEDQKEELDAVVPETAKQSPEETWISWIRTVSVLFYLNCFLLVSMLVFAIVISYC
ncbi:hypothetical protein CAEBREN_05143 [Caenorhabditis brenneri]|uniref:BTB domain-containing protein n=1 Tax=Caenorhabditis brenneri TaxID=135651 RepID=G0N3S8_CAEBE|nr:hypothetical protein CAEBREN_05143 [Caenorhabditis brenneri]